MKKTLLIALLLCGGSLLPAQAQNEAQNPNATFSIHAVSNITRAPVGVGIHWSRRGKLGGYIEARVSESGEPENSYLPGLNEQTVIDAGNLRLRERESWRIINAGVTYGVDERMSVFGGIGFSSGASYNRYDDPNSTFNNGNAFWVTDEDRGGGLNLNGGIVFRFNPSLVAEVGLDTRPFGLTLGLGFIMAVQ